MDLLKKKIRNREKTIGSWLTIPNEAVTEIMAKSGFDWLVLDMEHSPIDVEGASRLIRIIDLCGLPALCRLPSNNPVIAKNVLDAGAVGIIVPTVETSEEAKKAVESAYYPPKGKRGAGLGRAHSYGKRFDDYLNNIEHRTIVIVMIETLKGIENAEAIAGTLGVDALLIGPYDISASIGLIGQLDHPEINAALEKVLDAAANAGIGCGIHVVHPDSKAISQVIKKGYTFLALGVDMIFLDQAATHAIKEASSFFHAS